MTLPIALTAVGLLITLVIQTAAFAFFMGALAQRVAGVEARAKALEDGTARSDDGQSDVLVRLGRLEERMTIELEHIKVAQAAEGRQLEGLARQISSLAGQRRGAAPPLSDAYSTGV